MRFWRTTYSIDFTFPFDFANTRKLLGLRNRIEKPKLVLVGILTD